jgi:hypothetical protein
MKLECMDVCVTPFCVVMVFWTAGLPVNYATEFLRELQYYKNLWL